jgi:hypothetical protein
MNHVTDRPAQPMPKPPTRRNSRTLCLLAVAALYAAPKHAAAATETDVATRMIAQEGLAIALASNVLQSQLDILELSLSDRKRCHALPNGGSAKLDHAKSVSSTVKDTTVTVYYDSACQTPYITAHAVLTANTGAGAATITETAVYDGPAGVALGTLTLTESLSLSNSDEVVIGVGTFAPATGAPTVDLGLTCSIPAAQSKKATLNCEGGVAQNFPSLNLSLGSVTPLTLEVKTAGRIHPVTFSGAQSTRATAAIGGLSIVETSSTTLGLAGDGTAYSASKAKGKAAAFALFPPTPTGWTVTDTTHHLTFTLNVASDITRNATAAVTGRDGATLATIAVDQSGTGTISYADETSPVAITGWLLAD